MTSTPELGGKSALEPLSARFYLVIGPHPQSSAAGSQDGGAAVTLP